MAKQTHYSCDAINSQGHDCTSPAIYVVTVQIHKGNTTMGVLEGHACSNPCHLGELLVTKLGDKLIANNEGNKYEDSISGPGKLQRTRAEGTWEISTVNTRKLPKES